MKHILISLIGIGRKGNDGEKGYIKTKYKFDDGSIFETAFFGSALYSYLRSKGYSIKHWFIFGTRSSSWSEIIDAIDGSKEDQFMDIWTKIYEEEKYGLSDELVKLWEEALRSELPGIRLIPVDPLEYDSYIRYLLEELPEEDVEIIFDITHAYRYMSIVLAFSLMYIKNFKNIKGISIYYGALDMRNEDGTAPAVRIDYINDIFKLSTSYETYKNSGYFSDLLSILGIEGTERIYFKIEMNGRPRKELGEIINRLKDISKTGDIRKAPADILIRDLEPLQIKNYLEDRMVERALFFFEKKQYLKALILVYEAIDSLLEKLRDRVYNSPEYTIMQDAFNILKKIRNKAVHGDDTGQVQKYLENFKEFEAIFNNCVYLYKKLSKNL